MKMARAWLPQLAYVVSGLFGVACLNHSGRRTTSPEVRSVAKRPVVVSVKSEAKNRRAPCPSGTEQLGAEPPEGDMSWCVDNDGNKHGPYKTWYENGKIESEGEYSKGVRIGTWRYWSPSGKLERTEVRVDVCVYARSSRRALENVRVIAQHLGTRKFSFALSDKFGLAILWVSPGKLFVGIPDSPYFQSEREIEVSDPLTISFDLDDEVRRNLTARANVRLRDGIVASCKPSSASVR